MKKFLALALSALILFSLCGCNSNKYNTAVDHLNNKEFTEALIIFEELAATGYEDSKEMVKEVKYQYIKENLNNDDKTTYQYLCELSRVGYLDSANIYDELYSRKAKIAISTYKQSGIHYDVVNASHKTFPFYYFNFCTYGGIPEDEYRGTYEIIFSNGKKISDAFIGSDDDLYAAIVLSATQNPIGKTTFNLYDETGKLLATKTAVIK